MMCGWLRLAAVRASRLKRSIMSAPCTSCGDMTLMATLRVQGDLVGQEHRGHAALTDLPQHLVLAQGGLLQHLGQGGQGRRLLAGHAQPADPAEPGPGIERCLAAEAGGGHGHQGPGEGRSWVGRRRCRRPEGDSSIPGPRGLFSPGLSLPRVTVCAGDAKGALPRTPESPPRPTTPLTCDGLMTNDPSRRDLVRAGAALALGAALPSPLPHEPSTVPPTEPFRAPPLDRVRIGFVGVGGMGTVHLENLLLLEGVELRAVCDIREAHAARAAEKVVAAGQPEPARYTRGPRDFERHVRRAGARSGLHGDALGMACPGDAGGHQARQACRHRSPGRHERGRLLGPGGGGREVPHATA